MENGEIQVVVRDDGVGLPPGFDPRQDGHMGLQTVFILAERQLKARVNFRSEQGVSCQLEFSDSLYTARV
jgi:two-component sensor histidine kinase